MGHYGKSKRGEKEQIAELCGYYADETGKVFKRDGTVANQSEIESGYLVFYVEGYTVLTHRFVWHCQMWPIPETHIIDHIDTCRSNPRLENLRCVTQKENMQNKIPRSSWKAPKRKNRL